MPSKYIEHHSDSGERGALAPCCSRNAESVRCQNVSAGSRLPLAAAVVLAAVMVRIARLKNLHRDERGTISIVSVFAIFMFTILLVMVTNVARHADDKIRMQNAADAAAQTASVTLARGMNSIAFSNHLLSEVFALTAYMREAKRADEGTALLVPEILEEWRKIGQVFEQQGGSSGFTKFELLGRAIQRKVPLEQDVVDSYVLMSAEHSRMTLPVLEYILAGPNQNSISGPTPNMAPPDPLGGFIPRFQRAVVRNTPHVAHLAADEIAERHGKRVERQHDDRPLEARIWRTDLQMLGQIDESDPLQRTLPVIDPSPTGLDGSVGLRPVPYPAGGGNYLAEAQRQRERLAKHYLELWIRDWMGPYFDFDHFDLFNDRMADGMWTAKMSNLINLWRSATCDHLDQLLMQYPDTNVPHIIRDQPNRNSPTVLLEREYVFVAVVYWPHASEMFPGLFHNPLEAEGASDALTFAQSTVYVPQPRYKRVNGSWVTPWGWQSQPPPGRWARGPYRDNWPTQWDVLNQNWMAKLVPATSESIVPILQSNPGGSLAGFRPPRLGSTTMEQIRNVNMH